MEVTKHTGTLYLLPSPLSEGPVENVIPAAALKIIPHLRYFIVEEIRTARRFLKKAYPGIDFSAIQFLIYNEHSGVLDIVNYLEPLAAGNDMGLLSEAGLPCVADPGSVIVDLAHRRGSKVVPLTGPSSIFLALMASGFPGQNFAFQGYLPVNKNERMKKIRELERLAESSGQVQVFIETPYRNMQLFDSLIATCRPATRLCIATDLTGPSESIIQQTIGEWKTVVPDIHRKPAVFLLCH